MNLDVNTYDAFIGATAVPLLVGYLTKCQTPAWLNSLIAFAFCFVAAAVRSYITGDLVGDLAAKNYANAVVVTLIAAGISYKTVTGELAKKLKEIGPVK